MRRVPRSCGTLMSRQQPVFSRATTWRLGLSPTPLGYKVGHIAFDVLSDVPARFQAVGFGSGSPGQEVSFRLFIVKPPLRPTASFSCGGTEQGVAYLALILRYQSVYPTPRGGFQRPQAGYLALVPLPLPPPWVVGSGTPLAMPAYTLGAEFHPDPARPYLVRKRWRWPARNWGIIRPRRKIRVGNGRDSGTSTCGRWHHGGRWLRTRNGERS